MNDWINRRTFLSRAGVGLGAAALGSLEAAASGLDSIPHHRPRAKRVIFLCMAGGPSHLETFDYKEKLAKMDGQPMPESFTKGQPIAQLQGKKLKCQGPMTGFKRYGKSGQMISDFLPWHGRMAPPRNLPDAGAPRAPVDG